MIDFTKVQFTRGPRKPGIGSHRTSFRAELHLCTEMYISELELSRDAHDVLKKQVCMSLLDSLHYHCYGDLRPILGELESEVRRVIDNYNPSTEKIIQLFNKLEALLKKP